MRKPMTMDDLIALRDAGGPMSGTFFTVRQGIVPAPTGDEAIFPIASGPWPHPEPTAIKVTCECCKRDCGISPIGYELHQRNTKRPFLCSECFVGVLNMLQELTEEQPEERPN